MMETTLREQATELSVPLTEDLPVAAVQRDPESEVAMLERMAALVDRQETALRTILLKSTFASDWVVFEDNVCLKSAGAERIAKRLQGLRFSGVHCRKETFRDELGDGYRYSYEGYVDYRGTVLPVRGSYSTREPFLGKTRGEWRSLEEINESNIQAAAHHRFVGNGVKAILGIRNLPVEEWRFLCDRSRMDAKAASAVKFAKEQNGGTSAGDRERQMELANIILELVRAGRLFHADEDEGTYSIRMVGPGLADKPEVEICHYSCVAISGFLGDKGWIGGKDSPKDLKGKRLYATLRNAKQLYEEWKAKEGEKGEENGTEKPAGTN